MSDMEPAVKKIKNGTSGSSESKINACDFRVDLDSYNFSPEGELRNLLLHKSVALFGARL
jgi:hypothetical protein